MKLKESLKRQFEKNPSRTKVRIPCSISSKQVRAALVVGSSSEIASVLDSIDASDRKKDTYKYDLGIDAERIKGIVFPTKISFQDASIKVFINDLSIGFIEKRRSGNQANTSLWLPRLRGASEWVIVKDEMGQSCLTIK